ncbi:MAG TPA: hypothetical protein VNA25_13190, partial [Phycisphaerae bacterium]|nr:hypothetical protein [Phycisphaerae bacterium]
MTSFNAKVNINSNDRTSYVPLASINISEVVGNRTSTASFEVLDGGALGLARYQSVIITDWSGDTRHFAGYIHEVTERQVASKLHYHVECVDYSWDLEHPEDLINTTYTAQDDSAIIAAMMAACCPDIEASTHVETVYAGIPNLEFKYATPREILDKLAAMAGAYWYVDYGPGPGAQIAYLHYFDAATNDAPFDLSDTPDDVTTFGFEKLEEIIAVAEANKVIVVGYNEMAVTRTHGAEGDYGRWITTTLVDSDIRTEAQANAYGDNLLAQMAANPTYRCITREPGLRCGQTITLTDASRGISGNYEIQRLTTRLHGAGTARFEVEMGKFIPRLPELITEAWRSGGSGGGGKPIDDWEPFDPDDFTLHVHEYDKTDTPTSVESDDHSHYYYSSNANQTHTHTLTTGNQSAGHTHDVSGTTNAQSASHTHDVSGTTGTQSGDHAHASGSLAAANESAHTHTITVYSTNSGGPSGGTGHCHNPS